MVLLATRGASAVEAFDDRLVRVEASLPGFGGLFFDDAGRLNVYLKAAVGATAAELARHQPLVAQALASHFDDDAFESGLDRAPTRSSPMGLCS